MDKKSQYNKTIRSNCIYSINREPWRDNWEPVEPKPKYKMVQCEKTGAYYPVIIE
jgi:hypothetical protein